MRNYVHQQEECPFCKGNGYVQLILGGTENCPSCDSNTKWDENAE